MAQQLRALAALAEVLGIVPTPVWQFTIIYNFSSRGPNALFRPPWAPGIHVIQHINVCKSLIHIKIILKRKKNWV